MTPAKFNVSPALHSRDWAWPIQDEQVEAELRNCFHSGDWGKYHGAYNDQLKKALKELCRQDFCWTCSSGTIAVELALKGVGVQAGDEVVLAGYDFGGNFRAVESLRALPVLADLIERRWVVDPEQVESAITDKTKAIIVSHLHGDLAPIVDLQKIANRHNVAIVEDACQCPGARIAGVSAGSFGDASVLSFGGSKLLTAGRGGAVLTSQPQIMQRMKIHAERGNDAFPLSELQAASLLPQLTRLQERHAVRFEKVCALQELIRDWSWITTVPIFDAATLPAYYKVPFAVNLEGHFELDTEQARNELLKTLRDEGVPIDVGFRGFAKRSSRRCRAQGELTNSKWAASHTMLLHHPILLSTDEVFGRLLGVFQQLNQQLSKG